MRSIIKFIILFVLFFIVQTISAATIQGHIKDVETQEALIGAIIREKNQSHIGAATDFDGGFIIKNIPTGEYTFIVGHLGYLHQSKSIHITNDMNHYTLNFYMVHDTLTAEVVITGSHSYGAESDTLARKTEQNADNVINVVSANTIQILPDITVANVLQRVSGVSIERSSNGDGRYAIVRGMDPRYNYTLVNGIKIPSPDNKNRYVPLDLFPADLLERLEVIKALTPSMEGDAIGGVVNMVMKSAPYTPIFNVNLATGYSQMFFDRSYSKFDPNSIQKTSLGEIHGQDYQASTYDFNYNNFTYHNIKAPINGIAGITLAKRFFKNKFGVVLAGSYQNTYRATNSVFFNPNTQPLPGNVPTFDDIYLRQYSTQLTRGGVHSKLDYQINKNHTISLYNVYLQMNELQTRHTIDTALSISRTGTGTGNVYLLDRSRFQKQTIYNTTLQGNHTLAGTVKINWSAVYSLAKSNLPDWSETSLTKNVSKDANGNQVITPETLGYLPRRWQHNSDEDKSGYLNLSWSPASLDLALKKLAVSKVELSAGGMYRHKTRDNYYTEYKLTPKSNGGIIPPFDGAFTPDKYLFISQAASQGSPVNPNTYVCSENILAYYGQIKFLLFSKLQVLSGVRIENTLQKFETVMPSSFAGKSGSISYTDMLPSLHLKYMINSKQNLRFSYFKSISRPSYFEIIPYNIQGEYFTEAGNPYLKHTQAKNFDLRYEFFPKALDQILVGVFYKNILNPIEIAYVKSGTSGSLLQPQNFGTATNYGFEFVFTKFFGKIGFTSNYTYTNSSITTDKAYYYRDDNNQLTTSTVRQTRPLQGQSKHIANISLLYKNQTKGLEILLAYVYTGRRIVQLSPYKDLDYWQKGMSQLDFSFEKTIKKKFTFYAKITNILNSPLLVEIMQPNPYRSGSNVLYGQTRDDRILVQKEYYGQNYLLGIRYKF
ncbi:TonB-dependent receptor [Cytophaga aurantiaca]|uniref:TonB-dependent receptor n=1 Tax=Cytophaga aurantiaca TaxID=29530 RepID=UPI0004775D03|nr:TonB-dependent receptor [Cytophaga aurantiaca]